MFSHSSRDGVGYGSTMGGRLDNPGGGPDPPPPLTSFIPAFLECFIGSHFQLTPGTNSTGVNTTLSSLQLGLTESSVLKITAPE